MLGLKTFVGKSFGRNVLGFITIFVHVVSSVIVPSVEAQVSFSSSHLVINPNTSLKPATNTVNLLRSLLISPQDSRQIQFLYQNKNAASPDLLNSSHEIKKHIEYFMTALAVPEDQIWVNLSPTEADRLVSPYLTQTKMGEELLDQDRLLKQLTAQLIFKEIKQWIDQGKDHALLNYWMQMDQQTFSNDLLQKVWIVPDRVRLITNDRGVLIKEARLKCEMRMQEDVHNDGNSSSSLMTMFMQKDILPQLNRIVNHDAQFLPLRHIYHALILAAWFKRQNVPHVLNSYKNSLNLRGYENGDKRNLRKIYEKYVKLFQNKDQQYLMEKYNPIENQIEQRTLITGGVWTSRAHWDQAFSTQARPFQQSDFAFGSWMMTQAEVDLSFNETSLANIESGFLPKDINVGLLKPFGFLDVTKVDATKLLEYKGILEKKKIEIYETTFALPTGEKKVLYAYHPIYLARHLYEYEEFLKSKNIPTKPEAFVEHVANNLIIDRQVHRVLASAQADPRIYGRDDYYEGEIQVNFKGELAHLAGKYDTPFVHARSVVRGLRFLRYRLRKAIKANYVKDEKIKHLEELYQKVFKAGGALEDDIVVLLNGRDITLSLKNEMRVVKNNSEKIDTDRFPVTFKDKIELYDKATYDKNIIGQDVEKETFGGIDLNMSRVDGLSGEVRAKRNNDLKDFRYHVVVNDISVFRFGEAE